jgi:hypothetical protein
MNDLALISLLHILCQQPQYSSVSEKFCTEEVILLHPKDSAEAVKKARLVIDCRNRAEQQYGWDQERYGKCLKGKK